MEEDYYSILGINKNATSDEIKKVFRHLALKHHPDKGGDQEIFMKINKAYEILGNEEKRKEYDNKGLSVSMDDLSELFSFLNKKDIDEENELKKQKMDNVIKILKIPFKDTFKNNTIDKKILITRNCFECRNKCLNCDGKGYTLSIIENSFLKTMSRIKCNFCKSIGKLEEFDENCSVCSGNGHVQIKKVIQLEIPRGVSNGFKIISKENGLQPFNENDIAGDLIFEIQIEKKEIINTRVNLTFLETIIGKVVDIDISNDETIQLNLSGLTIINPRKKYVLEHNNKRIIITFNIVYPQLKKLKKDEIKLLEKILQ